MQSPPGRAGGHPTLRSGGQYYRLMPGASPKRILIVRISALGDIVFCTSLLEGLRRAHPDAHISWLAKPGFGSVLEADPRLNQMLHLPVGAPDSLVGLRGAMRLLRAQPPYDWVIDAQGLLKTRLLARMAPGARRIGFKSKEPGAVLLDELHAKGGRVDFISSEYRYLAQQLTGADPGPPRLLPGPEAGERADRLLRDAGLEPGFVALCPFTTRPQKHWVERNWGELAQRLSAAGLGRCAILGGPGDRAAAQRIMASMPPSSVDLVGATRVAELPALIERAGLVIGVDTGLTHIGIAVRRPVVALFGSTCPYTAGADSPLKVMYDALPCAPCKRSPTCNGAYTCMSGLTPARVVHEAAQLLGGP